MHVTVGSAVVTVAHFNFAVINAGSGTLWIRVESGDELNQIGGAVPEGSVLILLSLQPPRSGSLKYGKQPGTIVNSHRRVRASS